MSIQEILCIGSNILFIILTLVEITPIKINPWKFIARKLGSFLNVEINEKLDELKIQTNNQINELKKDISDLNKKVNNIEQTNEDNNMVQARIRILRFSDELRHNVNNIDYFSKDHFDQVMIDIDIYEAYCLNQS